MRYELTTSAWDRLTFDEVFIIEISDVYSTSGELPEEGEAEELWLMWEEEISDKVDDIEEAKARFLSLWQEVKNYYDNERYRVV